jgi:hypothetical protein
MTIQATARAVFAGLKATLPESVVYVIYEGTTATGIKDTESQMAGMVGMGDMGGTGARVFVSVGDLSKPARGKAIMVDGVAVFVASVKTDPAEALYEIEYTEQQPVE